MSRPPHRPVWSVRRLPLLISGALAAGLTGTATLAQQADAGSARTLETVVVTASGFAQDIRDAPASISVIPREELEQKPVQSIAEALREIEGIDVTDGSDKTGSLNIQMRGMGADYTLILVDGRRQNSVGNVQPNSFERTENNFLPPISAIERIEVIRGPMSTLYGADAMGGVVNIITRKVGDEWRGAVTLGTTIQGNSQFGNNANADFYIDGPLKQGLLGMSIRGAYVNNQENRVTYVRDDNGQEVTPTFSGNKVPNRRYDAGIRFALTPNKDHDITLEATWGRQKYDNSWCAAGTPANQIGNCGPMGQWDGGYDKALRFHRDSYVLAHTGRYGFGTWDTSFMHNTTETVGRLMPNRLDEKHMPPGVKKGDPRELKIRNLVFDTKLVTPLGTDNHLFTIGGQWWSARMNDTLVGMPMTHKQWSIFVEDEWSITKDLTLTLGARYDRHNRYGGHFSPRGYLVWNATPNWTLKGGVSKGYKAPKVNEMAPGIQNVGGQGRSPIIGGNPDMRPETSVTSELGVHYDNLRNFRASATVFHTNFKDKLESETVWNCRYAGRAQGEECVDIGDWFDDNGNPRTTFSRRTNLAKATTKGVELNARWSITEDVDFSANYTYTDSKVKHPGNAIDGRPLTSTPKHMANAKVTWHVNDQLNLWARAEYRGRRFRDVDTFNETRYYRPVTLAHIGAGYEVSKNVSLNFAVYNLFDKKTVVYEREVNNTGAVSYNNQYGLVEPGRRFWISTNVRF